VGASQSFERIADRYDETRGGERRGRAFAALISPHLAPGTVLEVGTGTGVVALGLAELRHPVVGVDLSPAMLARAWPRLGSVLAVADAQHLPMATASVGSAVFSWVLQLVADRAAALREATRVVRPGGRVLVIRAGDVEQQPVNDLDEVILPMLHGLRPALDTPEALMPLVGGLPLHLTTTVWSKPDRIDTTPAEMAALIERRTWSSMWDLAPERWEREVLPVLDAIRALPDQHRTRRREARHQLLVFDRDR
jgi:SAM-dependent methyltransferase